MTNRLITKLSAFWSGYRSGRAEWWDFVKEEFAATEKHLLEVPFPGFSGKNLIGQEPKLHIQKKISLSEMDMIDALRFSRIMYNIRSTSPVSSKYQLPVKDL